MNWIMDVLDSQKKKSLVDPSPMPKTKATARRAVALLRKFGEEGGKGEGKVGRGLYRGNTSVCCGLVRKGQSPPPPSAWSPQPPTAPLLLHLREYRKCLWLAVVVSTRTCPIGSLRGHVTFPLVRWAGPRRLDRSGHVTNQPGAETFNLKSPWNSPRHRHKLNLCK